MGNQSDRLCFFVDAKETFRAKCFRLRVETFSAANAREFLTGPDGTRGTLFGYPQPRAGHTTARDVLLTQTSATMSAMSTQAHAARLAANASRVTVRPRARPRARARDLPERRSTTPGFANRQTNV
jgi:hypothetical protein